MVKRSQTEASCGILPYEIFHNQVNHNRQLSCSWPNITRKWYIGGERLSNLGNSCKHAASYIRYKVLYRGWGTLAKAEHLSGSKFISVRKVGFTVFSSGRHRASR